METVYNETETMRIKGIALALLAVEVRCARICPSQEG